jgi:hypothetical protein
MISNDESEISFDQSSIDSISDELDEEESNEIQEENKDVLDDEQNIRNKVDLNTIDLNNIKKSEMVQIIMEKKCSFKLYDKKPYEGKFYWPVINDKLIKDFTICIKCMTKGVFTTKSRETSAMDKHLKSDVCIKRFKTNQEKQKTLMSFVTAKDEKHKKRKPNNEINVSLKQAISKFCNYDNIPYNVVNGTGFKHLCETIFKLGQVSFGNNILDHIPHESTIRGNGTEELFQFKSNELKSNIK